MDVRDGELKEELVLPTEIFSREQIKSRRASCYQRGVRSRLVFHKEDDHHYAYYHLTLVGLAHEMQFAIMMFSFFDDSEFQLRK
jgi:hypothetical protein